MNTNCDGTALQRIETDISVIESSMAAIVAGLRVEMKMVEANSAYTKHSEPAAIMLLLQKTQGFRRTIDGQRRFLTGEEY